MCRPVRACVLLLPLLAASGCATSSGAEGSEAAAQAVDSHLREAERRMRALDVEGAQASLAEAKEEMRNSDFKFHPEAALLSSRYNELVGRLELTREQKAERELELKVEAQRQDLERARTKVLEAEAAMERADVTTGKVDALRGAMEALARQIEAGKPFEPKSVSYKDDADYARRKLESMEERIALAKKRIAFMDGPGRELAQGLERMTAAPKEEDLSKRREVLAEARRLFQGCRDQGGHTVSEDAALAKSPVHIAAEDTTPKAAVARCGKELKASNRAVARVERALRKEAAKKKRAERAKKAKEKREARKKKKRTTRRRR